MYKGWPRLFLLVVIVFICNSIYAKGIQEMKKNKQERLEEFSQQKFGMFIHWGAFSVPAGEWKGVDKGDSCIFMHLANLSSSEFEQIASQFNPVKFSAKEWVELAKAAGMKYIVFVAKHHDGFCVFDSKLTDFDMMDATSFKRDPVKELADECKKAGITFCTYYSVVDWHHPDFPAKYSQLTRQHPDGYHGIPNNKGDVEAYAAYMKGQIRELLTNYGDIGIMWFDGGGSFRNYNRKELLHGEELVKMIHELQPGCLINDRLGFSGDYGTPEQTIPGAKSASGTFETCMTLSKYWGYNKNDKDWKDANTIVRNLVDIAGKGGNYLLNVSPTAEGLIPEQEIKVLREVGQWLAVNGEAVYGTQAGPARSQMRVIGDVSEAGCLTVKPGKLFITIFTWPKSQRIFIEGMKGGIVKKCYLLADPEQKPLVFEPHERSLFIDLPKKSPSEHAGVVVIEYDPKENIDEKNVTGLTKDN